MLLICANINRLFIESYFQITFPFKALYASVAEIIASIYVRAYEDVIEIKNTNTNVNFIQKASYPLFMSF